MPQLSLHRIEDAASHESAKCVADDVAAVEDGGTEAQFVAFVPFREEELVGARSC